ncbi:Antigen peptide transporter 2, partial [Podila humilis]
MSSAQQQNYSKEEYPPSNSSHVVDMGQDVTATPSTIDLSSENDPSATNGNDSKKKSKKSGKNKQNDEGQDDQEQKKPDEKISYFKLYRFASSWDMICVVLGTICAFVNGIGQPMVALLLGDVVTTLANNVNDITEAVADIRVLVIKFTVVGAIAFFAAYGQMCFWTLSAENQSKRIREKYLHAILRQDISWHDIGKKSESLNSRL